jgi:hypothetical protein
LSKIEKSEDYDLKFHEVSEDDPDEMNVTNLDSANLV